MTFQVGQKVVCVRDDFNGNHPRCLSWNERTPRRPRRGRIYTIRWIGLCTGLDGLAPGVLLHELRNPEFESADGFVEGTFCVSRFRPIVERKTDISIFTKMLAGAPNELEAAE